MPRSSALKKSISTLLSLTAAGLFVTAPSALAAAPDAPWAATGTAAIKVTSDGKANNNPAFDYSVVGNKGAWTFNATSKLARKQPVEWSYNGFHAWFAVRVGLESYITRGGKEVFKQALVTAGPVNCCAAPSGGFTYKGKTEFDLQPGDVYGFRLSGSHGDSDRRLLGTLALTIPDVTAPTITPVITGTKGANGYYTSDVKLTWKVEDQDSKLDAKTGCDDVAITADTAGQTFTCDAASIGGKSSQTVTIKRDAEAPQLTVPRTIVKQDAPAAGVAVDYATKVTDSFDKRPRLSCTPVSGATFPVGTTNVSCTASDAAGNKTTKDFEVIVLGAPAPAPIAEPAPAPAVTHVHMAGPVTVTQVPQGRSQINALLSFRFTATKKITRLRQLTVKNLPAGSSVTITCSGASCPKRLKGRTLVQKANKTSINISSLVKGPLKAGTTITVTVSNPAAYPTTKKLTVRKGKAPSVK
jgi:hypothetical protein